MSETRESFDSDTERFVFSTRGFGLKRRVGWNLSFF